MQNHNLGTLYCYEMKKIMKRKLVWATMFVCLVGVIVAVCSGLMGNYYVDAHITKSVSTPCLLRIYTLGLGMELVWTRHGLGTVQVRRCSKIPFTAT